MFSRQTFQSGCDQSQTNRRPPPSFGTNTPINGYNVISAIQSQSNRAFLLRKFATKSAQSTPSTQESTNQSGSSFSPVNSSWNGSKLGQNFSDCTTRNNAHHAQSYPRICITPSRVPMEHSPNKSKLTHDIRSISKRATEKPKFGEVLPYTNPSLPTKESIPGCKFGSPNVVTSDYDEIVDDVLEQLQSKVMAFKKESTEMIGNDLIKSTTHQTVSKVELDSILPPPVPPRVYSCTTVNKGTQVSLPVSNEHTMWRRAKTKRPVSEIRTSGKVPRGNQESPHKEQNPTHRSTSMFHRMKSCIGKNTDIDCHQSLKNQQNCSRYPRSRQGSVRHGIRKMEYLIREIRLFRILRRRLINLSEQQTHGVNVICHEFEQLRQSIVTLGTQIQLVICNLNQQHERFRDLNRMITCLPNLLSETLTMKLDARSDIDSNKVRCDSADQIITRTKTSTSKLPMAVHQRRVVSTNKLYRAESSCTPSSVVNVKSTATNTTPRTRVDAFTITDIQNNHCDTVSHPTQTQKLTFVCNTEELSEKMMDLIDSYDVASPMSSSSSSLTSPTRLNSVVARSASNGPLQQYYRLVHVTNDEARGCRQADESTPNQVHTESVPCPKHHVKIPVEVKPTRKCAVHCEHHKHDCTKHSQAVTDSSTGLHQRKVMSSDRNLKMSSPPVVTCFGDVGSQGIGRITSKETIPRKSILVVTRPTISSTKRESKGPAGNKVCNAQCQRTRKVNEVASPKKISNVRPGYQRKQEDKLVKPRPTMTSKKRVYWAQIGGTNNNSLDNNYIHRETTSINSNDREMIIAMQNRLFIESEELTTDDESECTENPYSRSFRRQQMLTEEEARRLQEEKKLLEELENMFRRKNPSLETTENHHADVNNEKQRQGHGLLETSENLIGTTAIVNQQTGGNKFMHVDFSRSKPSGTITSKDSDVFGQGEVHQSPTKIDVNLETTAGNRMTTSSNLEAKAIQTEAKLSDNAVQTLPQLDYINVHDPRFWKNAEVVCPWHWPNSYPGQIGIFHTPFLQPFHYVHPMTLYHQSRGNRYPMLYRQPMTGIVCECVNTAKVCSCCKSDANSDSSPSTTEDSDDITESINSPLSEDDSEESNMP